MKLCSKCKQDKDESEFHLRPTGKLYYQCKSCCRDYTKSHYKRNKKYYIAKARKNSDKVKTWLRDIKETTPCKDCGNLFPYYVMDFDHLKDKKFTIGLAYLRKGKAEIEKEIANCEVVCSNCHRIRTHKRLRNL